jgi:hypothetical protein
MTVYYRGLSVILNVPYVAQIYGRWRRLPQHLRLLALLLQNQQEEQQEQQEQQQQYPLKI